jgi:hypothetical protein
MKFTAKIVFSITIILSFFNLGCSSKLTGETTGQITRVALDRDTKTKKRKTSSNKTRRKTTTTYETEIDYSYTVNGKTYEGYSEKDGDVQRDFRSGSAAVVCYDPKNPEESDVFAAGHKCAN